MTRRILVVALLGAALPGVAGAQRTAPLLKSDLIELLSSPVIAGREVAALVRRNCLAFRPTERDLADIRSLGASPDVEASIAACGTTPIPRPPEGPAALTASPPAAVTPSSAPSMQVFVRQRRFVAAAGSQQTVVVLAALGGVPQTGVQIALRGSAALDGGGGRDLTVATDDSGYAVFPVRVGRRLATYRFEVAPAAGGVLPGRPTVEIVVRAGPPASAYVEPRAVTFDQGLDSIVPISATVRDSVGHAVVSELVVLGGNPEAAGFRPDTAVTDSLGRARLVVAWGDARRGGTLQLKVRGRQLAWVDVIVGVPVLEGGTGFLPAPSTSGTVRNGLGAPVVFEARTRLGKPAVGRTVSFRGVNATVSPTTANTDADGRARVEVTLGDRVGPAMVFGTVDSLEKQLTLQVEPGPAVEIAFERNGSRVDGRWLVVALDTTFVLRIRARDAYGNSTGVAGLARILREMPWAARMPLARLVSIEEEPSAVAVTLKAARPGRATFKLHAGDISAFTWMEVVPVR
jgi:hypothetical protein